MKRCFCPLLLLLALWVIAAPVRPQGVVPPFGSGPLVTPAGAGAAYSITRDDSTVVGSVRTARGDDHASLWRGQFFDERIDLGTLGGRNSQAFSINGFDSIVGAAQTLTGTYHAVLWRPFERVDLGTLGGRESAARSVNYNANTVQVAGTAQTRQGQWHAAVWQRPVTGGEIRRTDLGTLGGANSYGFGIDELGRVVGSAQTRAGVLRAVIWRFDSRQRRYVPTDLGTLGGRSSEARGIDPLGNIAGTAELADGTRHMTLWTPDGSGYRTDDFGTLGGRNSSGNSIRLGEVLGSSELAPRSPERHAVVFRAGPLSSGLEDMNKDLPDGTHVMTDVIDKGKDLFVGTGLFHGRPYPFLAIRNPAPGSVGGIDTLSASAAVVPSGGSLQLDVFITVPAGPGGFPIALASSDPSVATVPATVTVPQGQSDVQFTVQAAPGLTQSTTVNIQATDAGGGSASITITINPPGGPGGPGP
jgi:probable HAF family extracellular repeat protein